MKKQTFLITGGTGFLGCHLARNLVNRGHRVKLLDLETLNEPDLWGQVENYVGDIRNKLLVDRLMQGVDVVIHAAAALPLAKPKEIIDTTVRGTKIVLEAAKKNHVKRVVYISSTAVYGVPEKHPILESDPRVGVGPYGNAKIEAEKICEKMRKQKMAVAIIRPKTFIGTGRLGVFQILFDWVRRGAKIPVIGDGSNRYQLMDVEDLANAVWLAASRPTRLANDTFNVGGKKFKTIEEDLNDFFKKVGSESRVLKTPAGLIKGTLAFFERLGLSPLYAWVYATADKDSFVSTEKIEKKLGWRAKYSNTDTLVRTFEWYQKHWKEYEHQTGITHRVAWKQGILKIARWILQ
ncbi:MAG: NAD(P)-dependent oxidoreductase [Candidatus Peribacteraceae bacterium]|nr:NAD(P)-dependent oxidoreductase [Candidatus Peribacteraceae bacterium]